MTLVTVGMPFFDEERLLGDAIRSVLAQTFRDFELLLVDDGSTDGSLEVARSFRDPRMTVLSDGARRQLPARLNEIVRRATTPYVARMDADDVMHPRRLEREVEVMREHPSCDVVGTWAVWADEHGRPFGVSENGPLPPTTATALAASIVPHATILGRREWFAANPYDERLTRAEDRELWCRTAASAEYRVVPECLYVVRVSAHDPGFLDGYVDAQRQNRIVYAKYGPRAVGLARTAKLVVGSYARSGAMRALAAAGLADRLVRRRGRAPTEHERALAAEALAAASPQRA